MSMTPQESQVLSEALNTIEELKQKLQGKANEKAVKTLLEEINTGFIKTLKSLADDLGAAVDAIRQTATENRLEKKDLIKAIQGIKIEPNVNVTTPEIKGAQVSIPPIKIPEIVVPKPQVTVNVPETKFPAYPKEMAVTGFAGMLKSIAEAFKGVFRVEVQQDRDKPLNVILCDDKGNHYKATGGGGIVGGMVGAGNSAAHRAMQAAIATVTLTLQNTVYTYAVPKGTQRVDFRLRSGDYSLLYSYDNFTNYFTLPAGSIKTLSDVNLEDKTLYFKCADAASEVVEIETLKR